MTSNEQIISVLDYMCEKLGLAIDWTADNMMPYVSELVEKFIRYEIVTSVVSCVLMVVFTIVPYLIFKKFHPLAKKAEYDFGDGYSWVAVFSCVTFIIMLIATIIAVSVEIFDIIECVVLPEKFIADYAMNLLQSK